MFFNFTRIGREKLTALKFADDETFRKAARVAAAHNIPVDAPGHRTLIIRKSDKKRFPFKFEEEPVIDPEKLSPKELSAVRFRRFLNL